MDRFKCKPVFEYEDLVYTFAPLFGVANIPFGDKDFLFNMVCSLCRLICVIVILLSWLNYVHISFFLVLWY